eukprot:g5681.t1
MMMLDEGELARQLTIVDSEVFASIRTCELVNKAWTDKKHKRERAPAVTRMIARFNEVSRWAVSLVLAAQGGSGGGGGGGGGGSSSSSSSSSKNSSNGGQPPLGSSVDGIAAGANSGEAVAQTLEMQVAMVGRLVRMMQACRDLNNFHACYALFCGIKSHYIMRMRPVMGMLPAAEAGVLASLEELFAPDANFSRLRDTIDEVASDAPCVPHLGLFLGDLTFLDEGQPTFVRRSVQLDTAGADRGYRGTSADSPVAHGTPLPRRLINVGKLRKCARIVERIRGYQHRQYVLQPDETLHQYFSAIGEHAESAAALSAKSKSIATEFALRRLTKAKSSWR